MIRDLTDTTITPNERAPGNRVGRYADQKVERAAANTLLRETAATPHPGREEETTDIDADPYVTMSVCIDEEMSDELGLLKHFSADFSIFDDNDQHQNLGNICGWIGWRVLDENVSEAADSISADAAYIGHVAAQLLESDANDSLIEDVLLIDRMWIEPGYRGHGLLRTLIDHLVAGFRLHVNGCFVVTEPEPQRATGGPYPDGPAREKAMNGLLRSLHNAGFTAWVDDRAQWRRVE